MFDHILLEKEQEELLLELVEFERNVPRDKRQKFVVHSGNDKETLGYPGRNLGKKICLGDIEILGQEGLLAISYSSHGTPKFDITPLGFRYYEYLKQKLGQPIERLQATIRDYLSSGEFAKKYPNAFQKWIDADNLLWQTDSEKQHTTIGHLCREALQEFANYLIQKYYPEFEDKNKAHDITRIKAVLDSLSSHLGKTEKPFLNALITYWGTVSDLVQRQEHGGQKEGETLVWEDARRVVFQTAMIMFEVEKSIARIR
jgi:hypothetical protein